MRPIVADILSLFQYVKHIQQDPRSFRPDVCPYCGRKNPRCHGHYARKADRENPSHSSLNPIWIFRFYCPDCCRTCSVLPECIPPHRWYLWVIQQAVLELFFLGQSFRKISQQLLPSRWTISRWVVRLRKRFELHALHLKSLFSWLGYTSGFIEFWQRCLAKMSLSTAMLQLNNLGVVIP